MKLTINKTLFILLLVVPLVNTIADSTINFFDREEGFFHLGILRGFYMLLIIVIFNLKNGFVKERASIVILGFFIYLFFLLPMSSRFFYSFSTGYIKWFGSLLLFPLGVYFFRTKEHINTLLNVLLWAAIPIILNFFLAQVFKLGGSAYIEDSFYYGGANIGITNSLSFIVLSTPIFFILNKDLKRWRKVLVGVIILLSIFSIVMLMKRSAILGLALGFSVYLFFSPQKGRVLNFLALGSLAVFLTLPLFADELEKRIDARTGERNRVENEARYKEIHYVFKEFKEGGIGHKLFGTEPFNSRQFFGPKYFNRDRMIHGDLSSFFYGTGLVGLLWYLMVYSTIGFRNFFFFKRFYNSTLEREFIAIVFAFLACGFLITVTGTGTMGERGIMYLTMGALFGYLRNTISLKHTVNAIN